MDRPRIYVDFNEMIDTQTVLLSQSDVKRDSSGAEVELREGLAVYLYMDDIGERGAPDPLLAQGLIVRNENAGWAKAAKWLLSLIHI